MGDDKNEAGDGSKQESMDKIFITQPGLTSTSGVQVTMANINTNEIKYEHMQLKVVSIWKSSKIWF